MASRSSRKGDRERQAYSSSSGSNRTNDYFVPKDGIDREVIQADICRYLGRDALVRPGSYENPETRTVQQGYFVTAYRNLTSAMIDDLKADSARWEAERMQTAGRGPNAEYRSSTIHQSRQWYGPSEGATAPPTMQYAAEPPSTQLAYDNREYQQQSYNQPVYSAPYTQENTNYYVAGANLATMAPADARNSRPDNSSLGIPRDSMTYSTSTGGYSTRDPGGPYYSPPSGQAISSSNPYAEQQAQPSTDSSYYSSRAPPSTSSYQQANQEQYDDPRYQQQYPQSSMPSSSSTGGSGSSSRRDGEKRRRQ